MVLVGNFQKTIANPSLGKNTITNPSFQSSLEKNFTDKSIYI